MTAKPDCYWVRPGVLMAGEYPGAEHLPNALPRLEALHADGIRSFIDLTEEQEHELTDYHPLAEQLGLVWHRLPIVDVSIPTRERMREILDHLNAEIAAGRPVYVHCWGGVGRTGTVIGCWLREAGFSYGEALAEIARLRSQTVKAWRASPETGEQRAFIADWR